MASSFSPAQNLSYENLLLANSGGYGGGGGGGVGMMTLFAACVCIMSVLSILGVAYWYYNYDGESKIDELINSFG